MNGMHLWEHSLGLLSSPVVKTQRYSRLSELVIRQVVLSTLVQLEPRVRAPVDRAAVVGGMVLRGTVLLEVERVEPLEVEAMEVVVVLAL